MSKSSKAKRLSSSHVGWIIMFSSWILAFSIACQLTITPLHAYGKSGESSFSGKVLNESRLALSSFFFNKADEYFHKGIPYVRPKAFSDSFFVKTSLKVAPEYHIHAEGKNINEIMPWLKLALQSEPRNIEPAFVAAFWLSSELEQPDLALEILKDAKFNNPFNYDIALAMARIYLDIRDFENAKKSLNKGLGFIEARWHPEDTDQPYIKSEILLYHALICEADGDNKRAIQDLEEILSFFPDRTGLRDRIETLKKGNKPSMLPDDIWKAMIKSHEASAEHMQ